MAKKKSVVKKRKRRTSEEMIADLQEQIAQLKVRAEAKQLKQSAAIKHSLAAVKAIDKGITSATEEGEKSLHHALLDARGHLEAHLTERGIKLPVQRRPRGPRPK